MQKKYLWMLAAILVICGATVMRVLWSNIVV